MSTCDLQICKHSKAGIQIIFAVLTAAHCPASRTRSKEPHLVKRKVAPPGLGNKGGIPTGPISVRKDSQNTRSATGVVWKFKIHMVQVKVFRSQSNCNTERSDIATLSAAPWRLPLFVNPKLMTAVQTAPVV